MDHDCRRVFVVLSFPDILLRGENFHACMDVYTGGFVKSDPNIIFNIPLNKLFISAFLCLKTHNVK